MLVASSSGTTLGRGAVEYALGKSWATAPLWFIPVLSVRDTVLSLAWGTSFQPPLEVQVPPPGGTTVSWATFLLSLLGPGPT